MNKKKNIISFYIYIILLNVDSIFNFILIFATELYFFDRKMKKILFFVFFIAFLFTSKDMQGQSQYRTKKETGHATYYARRFHNKPTASGEIYKRDELVCAHKTHPFGTLLKVRNKDNGKEVIVRVIDRGPHMKRRIIDLSFAAASTIDMVRDGVANVEISVYNKSKPLLAKIEKLMILPMEVAHDKKDIDKQLKLISQRIVN